MKKVIYILACMALSLGVQAQSKSPDDLDIIQSVFGKSKKQLAELYMNLKGDAAAKFWQVYDSYEAERRELVRTRLYTLAQYAESYASMNDETAAALAKQAFKNEKAVQKLHQKYFNKMKKAAGALNASKFMQMETYLQKIVELEVLDDIPFIGEMDALKK